MKNLILFLSFVFLTSLVNAQVTKEFVKTIDPEIDTIEVASLQNVQLIQDYTDLESIKIVERVEVVNTKNQRLINNLAAAGYFNIVPRGTSNRVSYSDHSEKAVNVAGQDLDIKRTYIIYIPFNNKQKIIVK